MSLSSTTNSHSTICVPMSPKASKYTDRYKMRANMRPPTTGANMFASAFASVTMPMYLPTFAFPALLASIACGTVSVMALEAPCSARPAMSMGILFPMHNNAVAPANTTRLPRMQQRRPKRRCDTESARTPERGEHTNHAAPYTARSIEMVFCISFSFFSDKRCSGSMGIMTANRNRSTKLA